MDRNSGWTRNVSAARPVLQMERVFLMDEITGFQTPAPTDNLRARKFELEVVKMNKALVEKRMV